MSLFLAINFILLTQSGQTYYHLRPLNSLEKEGDSCYSCHTSIVLNKKNFLPVLLERKSIHFDNDKYCSDCHKAGSLLMKRFETNRDKIFSVCPFYKKVNNDRNKINDICGSCHKKELEDMLSGVHKNKLSCIYCHSNHGIKKADLDIIRPEKCSECHKYPDIAPVRDEFRKVETILLATESNLKKYKEKMPEIYNKYILKINLAREGMKSQRHKLNRAEISSNTNHILLLSGHIRKEIVAEQERIKAKRLIRIGIILIIILAIIGVLYYLYQYYKWRRTLNRNTFFKE